MTKPTPLRRGDTVAITAASGPVNPEKLSAGIKILESMGLTVHVTESCRTAHEYLAAPDNIRLRDLHSAFADKKIKAIFMARGGYGSARLLPHLNIPLIRDNPKIFAGYSDTTALHTVLNQSANLITYHAPMPAADLPTADETTLKFFEQALFENQNLGGEPFCSQKGSPPNPLSKKTLNFNDSQLRNSPAPPFKKTLNFLDAQLREAKTPQKLKFEGRGVWGEGDFSKSLSPQGLIPIVKGNAVGPLTGGNLTVIASMIGTEYEIDTRGRILFLEETGESAYRVDRLLLQLKLAGKLGDASGFVLGDFSPETTETIKLAIGELLVPEGKPILAGLACGHCMPNITLPLGQTVQISTESLHPLQICDHSGTS